MNPDFWISGLSKRNNDDTNKKMKILDDLYNKNKNKNKKLNIKQIQNENINEAGNNIEKEFVDLGKNINRGVVNVGNNIKRNINTGTTDLFNKKNNTNNNTDMNINIDPSIFKKELTQLFSSIKKLLKDNEIKNSQINNLKQQLSNTSATKDNKNTKDMEEKIQMLYNLVMRLQYYLKEVNELFAESPEDQEKLINTLQTQVNKNQELLLQAINTLKNQGVPLPVNNKKENNYMNLMGRRNNNATPRNNNAATPRNNNAATPRNNNVTPRNNNVTPRNNNVTPRNNNVTPRNNNVTPRNNNVTQRNNNAENTNLTMGENNGANKRKNGNNNTSNNKRVATGECVPGDLTCEITNTPSSVYSRNLQKKIMTATPLTLVAAKQMLKDMLANNSKKTLNFYTTGNNAPPTVYQNAAANVVPLNIEGFMGNNKTNNSARKNKNKNNGRKAANNNNQHNNVMQQQQQFLFPTPEDIQ